jgi:hypothetical protein
MKSVWIYVWDFYIQIHTIYVSFTTGFPLGELPKKGPGLAGAIDSNRLYMSCCDLICLVAQGVDLDIILAMRNSTQ